MKKLRRPKAPVPIALVSPLGSRSQLKWWHPCSGSSLWGVCTASRSAAAMGGRGLAYVKRKNGGANRSTST